MTYIVVIASFWLVVGGVYWLARQVRKRRKKRTKTEYWDMRFLEAIENGDVENGKAQAILREMWRLDSETETSKRLARIAELTQEIETHALNHASQQLVVARQLIILRRDLIAELPVTILTKATRTSEPGEMVVGFSTPWAGRR